MNRYSTAQVANFCRYAFKEEIKLRKQYTIVALLLVMAMVLTACSLDEVKEKFVGGTETVSGPSAASDSPVIIEDYDPVENVTLGEYKNVEVDCTVTEEEKQPADTEQYSGTDQKRKV